MDLHFKQIKQTELAVTFDLFKRHMKPIIEEAFGWDDSYQENGFKKRLKLSWFHWVYSEQSPVGLVCYKTTTESVHIHLLIVFDEMQRQGFGKNISRALLAIAHQQGLPLTLSCFKNNRPAYNLYNMLGFTVNAEDQHFYSMINRIP
ncbi:GNAT family N-acetyltransferase ['Osedax' symbiont bacterium Rs2_46_30_T18]|nr:GNAT family N-acetyltransferase ['Osedax' symbiont bacterium Rs2_46_30_T18]